MFVSVILPIRNEAPFIHEVLSAVLTQDYPGARVEVLVVDGMSEDGTREIVRRLAESDPRLRMLDNPRRNTPAALNLGIRAARGEIIVRVDGHGVLPPDYIRECVTCLSKEQGAPNSDSALDCGDSSPLSAHSHLPPSPPSTLSPQPSTRSPLLAVGGAWDCVGRGSVGEPIALATSSRFGVGNARYRTCNPGKNPVATDSVPFWAMRRDVFERIGLFREEMLCHEDYEFNHRLRQAGGPILLLPWLRATYYVRSNLRGLARQYWRYGFWKGRFLRSHPGSLQARHLIPPLFVAALVVATLAACVGGAGRVASGILAAAYLCFLVVATVTLLLARSRQRALADSPAAASLQSAESPVSQSAIGNRESDIGTPSTPRLARFALLPVILATLHLCWGSGVWVGLMRGKVPGQPPKL